MIGLLAMVTAMQMGGAPDPRGVAGVCVRWDGPAHVGDAVVVVSSGDPTLDATISDTLKAMAWPRPDPPYDGGWVGITFAFDGTSSDMPPPDCTKHHLPERNDQPTERLSAITLSKTINA